MLVIRRRMKDLLLLESLVCDGVRYANRISMKVSTVVNDFSVVCGGVGGGCV